MGAFSIQVILRLVFFNLMVNGYTPLIEIFFIFKFYILLFFYIKILFSLTTAYDIPFYRFAQQFLFFYYLVTL